MLAKNLREWRKLVLERDNHICQICSEPGNTADHITSKTENPSLLLETDNGRTLCRSCHAKHGSRLEHSKYSIEDKDILGISKLHLIGRSLMLVIPPWFIKKNNLSAGSKVCIAANPDILQIFIPK